MKAAYGIKRCFSSTGSRFFFNKFFKHVVDAAPKEHVVENLARPIGLKSPPTSSSAYSKGNSFTDMFDNAKTDKRSQELGLEFSKSGMYELHTFRTTGGKLFQSPPSYWRSDKALYFPHLRGKNLLGTTSNIEDVLHGKTSIIRMFTSKVGDDLVKSYFKNEESDLNYLGKDYEALANGNKTQIVQLNMMENFLKSIIMKLSLSKLKAMVPPEFQSTYFTCQRPQIPYLIREQLQINNVYTGYVIVVDPNLKIRWMGCGSASTEEFKTLWKCVRNIRKEFRDY